MVSGMIFFFFDLKKKTAWFKTRRFIFALSIVSLCIVIPITTWYFIINDIIATSDACPTVWECKPALASIFDMWVYFYGCLQIYPPSVILLNFLERHKYAPRIWNKDRWAALFRGDYNKETNGVNNEHLNELLNKTDRSSHDVS